MSTLAVDGRERRAVRRPRKVADSGSRVRPGMGLPIALSLAPGLALFGVFFVMPFAVLVVTAFSAWDGADFAFNGAQNFERMLADSVFWKAMVNTLYYAAVGVFVQVPLGALTGIILAQKIRGWQVFRAIIFIPWVISGAAFALVFSMFYNPRFGLLNDLVQAAGLGSGYDFLFDTSTARWAVAGTFAFILGFTMIIVMAEIAGIPKELYEAAECDGARGWKKHRHITLPLLRNAIGTSVLIRLLADLGLFDIVYILTSGGPNDATVSLALYAYRAYLDGQWGFANAAGSVILVLGLICIVGIGRLFRIGERVQ